MSNPGVDLMVKLTMRGFKNTMSKKSKLKGITHN